MSTSASSKSKWRGRAFTLARMFKTSRSIVTLQIKYARTLTFQNFSPALGAGQYGVSEHERRFNAAKMSWVRNIWFD
jgi:hypothetical protein